MPVKIRLARAGAKKRPYYRIVAADVRSPRDGGFLERLGTFDPLKPKDNPERITLKVERIKYWLSKGAQPTDRVARFLGAAEIIPMPAQRSNPQKAKPKAKAQARLEEQKAAAEASAAESAAPKATPEAAKPEAAPPEAAPESGAEAPAEG